MRVVKTTRNWCIVNWLLHLTRINHSIKILSQLKMCVLYTCVLHNALWIVCTVASNNILGQCKIQYISKFPWSIRWQQLVLFILSIYGPIRNAQNGDSFRFLYKLWKVKRSLHEMLHIYSVECIISRRSTVSDWAIEYDSRISFIYTLFMPFQA